MPDWLDPAWIETLRLGLLGRLLLATVLGGVIGLERELSGKPAGLRTNILICVGAALLMDVSEAVAASATTGPADPGRIAAQVVSGIGFIGAGTILVERGAIVGLTTAATIWVVAAIGLAVGSHAYIEAVGATILVGLTLVILGRVEHFLFGRRQTMHLELVADARPELLNEIGALFKSHRVRARRQRLETQADRIRALYELGGPARRRERALNELSATEGVRKITVR